MIALLLTPRESQVDSSGALPISFCAQKYSLKCLRIFPLTPSLNAHVI